MSEAKWYKCRLDEPNITGWHVKTAMGSTPQRAAAHYAESIAYETGTQFSGTVTVIGADDDNSDDDFPKTFEVKTWLRQMSRAEEVDHV